MSHVHAIVWLDHRHATVVGLSGDRTETVEIDSQSPNRQIHRKSGIPGSGHAPVDVEFFSDVASALDGTQTLWDLRARRRLGKSFPARTGGDAAAHFAPDGDVVIAYLGEGAIWPTDARVWQRYACQVAGRDLTRAEWSDVLPDRDYRRVCSP